MKPTRKQPTKGRRGRPPRRRDPTPRAPASDRAAGLVDAIVDAAALVLSRGGVAKLTTNRVAEAAGVSIGSLYQYFPNKEAIVSALFDRYLKRMGDMVRDAMEHGTSADDIAHGAARRLLETSPVDRAVIAQMWELRTAANAHARVEAQTDELAERGAAALVRLGLLPPSEAQLFAFAMIHAADGIANALSRHPEVDAARVAAMYIGLVRRYFAP
jgi:AcrR family transcriptional regulator